MKLNWKQSLPNEKIKITHMVESMWRRWKNAGKNSAHWAKKTLEAIKKYPKIFGFLGSMTALSAGIWYSIGEQNKVNQEHFRLNHAFKIWELSSEEKVRMLLGTNLAPSRFSLSNEIPTTWLVHFYANELRSIEEARKHVIELRESGKAYIISADIEWWWVNHLQLSPEELKTFGIPEKILKLREQELEFYDANPEIINSKPLPTQEWFGRTYDMLKTEEEKIEFLRMMHDYGVTIAKICEHIGINLVFWPVLDRVADIDGKNPIEYNDRSFGENYTTISDLTIAYLSGFKQISSVAAVPKHFVGNGASISDPHHWSSQTYIDPNKGTGILPFRDVINFANGYNFTYDRNEQRLENLKSRNIEHIQRLESDTLSDQEKRKVQASIDANNLLIKKYEKLLVTWNNLRLRKLFDDGIDLPMLMVSNVATNLYGDSKTPTMFSKNAINSLKRRKNEQWLWFEWVLITDDAAMESAEDFIESKAGFFSDFDTRALSAYTALGAGNDLVFMRFIAGEEQYIASEIVRYIEQKIDLDEDGAPDLTEKRLHEITQRVLELKVELWILSKQILQGEEYYILNPNAYNPTEKKVLRDSFFSNQWPWLERDTYYEALWRKDDQWILKLSYKAAWNFSVSLYSVLLSDFWILDNERYEKADTKPKELIVVDKSAKYLWRYDAASWTLIESFEIGIGKWWEGPRRVVWDHRTPAGHYMVVQKRDDLWWREYKWVSLPDFYGWDDGGMLVLAWPWAPEIAIHGSNFWSTWEVSNGCVRVDDEKVQELMKEVPLGSMVIITN